MIGHIRGKLVEAQPTRVCVECGGLGYEVLIPLSSYGKLPAVGAEVFLRTHLTVREDAHILFGFATEEERELFRLLIDKVSGVGPVLALKVLSGVNPDQFKACVMSGDAKTLSKLPGLGKKTAERIIVELKDKMSFAPAGASPAPAAPGSPAQVAQAGGAGADARFNDAVGALAALGFKQADAWVTVRDLLARPESATLNVEAIVREAIKKLT
ncbi:Holliday junction branch migration protein RuvA [Oscillatoria amoena NRMC-F 0135]|nr:Holliday junction branch migration protein RuvA [Oscillatoria amoena NRMC-F 0135]